MIKHSDDKPNKPRGDRGFDDKFKNRSRKSIKEVDATVTLGEEIVATDETAAADVVELIPSETVKKPEAGRARGPRANAQEPSEFVEKVIAINRITKVTKGGKKLSFSALVVVGDMKGKVGYNLSKAKEVSIAIRKALNVAKRNMIKIPMKGTTITHEIIGQCGASCVLLKPASEGTGVIASGPVRAVCDGAGIRDILTKVHRSNNPINVVKATVDALSRLKPARVELQEVK